MPSAHLPYAINPSEDRAHYYETYWKEVGLRLLLKHCQPTGATVLDYGCGRGESLKIYGDAGFRVTGADVDPECVRLSSRFGTAVELNPADPVGQFGRKSFDVVTCFHVLEHVDSPRKTLGELSAIARKHVVLAVPNLRYLNRMFTRQIDLRVVNEGHLQSWDHWHLLNLAERYCNLRLIEWGFDATRLPGLSAVAEKLLGQKGAVRLETGLFRKLFPFHGISVLGLFAVQDQAGGQPSQ